MTRAGSDKPRASGRASRKTTLLSQRLPHVVLARAIAQAVRPSLPRTPGLQFGTQTPQQHTVCSRRIRMILEARSLEPLRQHRIAIRICLHLRLPYRVAEERQRLGHTCSPDPVELQTMARPIAPERLIGDGMAGWGEVVCGAGVCLGERLPVTRLTLERFDAETTKEHVVWSTILRMEFEARAFQPLTHPAIDLPCGVCRIAEDGKSTLGLPVVTERSI